MPGSEPDSGKPTVRDLRGACGNVGYGGTRNPPHIPKGCVTVTLRLRLRAPQFYPDYFNLHFCISGMPTIPRVILLEVFS